MAEKDVKSAKKLYAKMKKAQKVQNRQESPTAADNEADTKDAKPEEKLQDETIKTTEKSESAASPAVLSEPESQNIDAHDSSPEATTQKEEQTQPDPQPEKVSTKNEDEVKSNSRKETTEVLDSKDTGSKDSDEPPAAIVEKTDKSVEGNNIDEHKTGTESTPTGSNDISNNEKDPNQGRDEDNQERAIEKPAAESAAAPSVSTNITSTAGETEQASLAELVAELRGENDSLHTQVKKLENRVKSLEAELAASRSQHTEVSLSPPSFPQNDSDIRSHRTRASSFVEADLYSESERVNDRKEQMKKWKGYQLDLLSWSRPLGIGAPFTI